MRPILLIADQKTTEETPRTRLVARQVSGALCATRAQR